MNKLKINFRLQELDKIMPFGTAPDLTFHWFGLTDGYLWIDVGNRTIYEYSDWTKVLRLYAKMEDEIKNMVKK